MKRTSLSTGILLAVFILAQSTFAGFNEPQPGEIYRDYVRTMSTDGNTWRVTDPNASYPGSGQFLPNPVLTLSIDDLQGATRAEVIVDLWGGHPGTTNKRFRFNNHEWITLPELATTPTAGECYTQQSNITVNVPLSDLVQGNNTLEGTSGGQTCFNFGWGQWGWYGVVVRIHYNSSKPHAAGHITSHTTGATFGENPTFGVGIQSGVASQVEFLGYYEGYDTDGDGIYRDWQRNYHRGRFESEMRAKNHIGTATASPWQVTWNTDWVPNQQPRSVKLVARIRDNNGLWFVTDIVDSLTFLRTNGVVKLYTSTNVSESFWVRAGETKSCIIPIHDPQSHAIAAKLYLATWNGVDGQGNGDHWKRVNAWSAPIVGEDHYYAYNEINVPVSALLSGNNTFSFFSGTIHHGVEIMWPGPALAVRYSSVTSSGSQEFPAEFSLEQNYPNPFNPVTDITYSLAEQAEVTLRVFDVLGQVVTTLTQGLQDRGYFTARWGGTNSSGKPVSSGVYIYRLEAKNISGERLSSTKRMLLIK